MSRRQWVLALTVLSILCTLALLLFPLASGQGPYPATHGPVTAFRALRAAALLRLSMLLAASSLLAMIAGAAGFLSMLAAHFLDFLSNYSRHSQASSILRC